MMHANRTWSVSTVESAETLAQMLSTSTWTLCTGFVVAGYPEYLFLNDATSEDGAGEFGVIKGGLQATAHLQIESITFSWCTTEQALAHIQATLSGQYDASPFAHPVVLTLEDPDQHGRCPLCA